jgi:sugar phosphate isomerase/epimerase
MRFGCVIVPDQIGAAIEAGFDYVELPARELDLEGQREQVLRKISGTLRKSYGAIKVEVFSGLLPDDLLVVGPQVDQERLRRYLRQTFTAMWALGGVLVVLGIGASRSFPEGFPRERAEAQFAEVLRLIEEEGDRNGLDLALDPLNRAETNLLTTLDQSRRFLAEHQVQEVKLLADIYHLTAEDESLEVIEDCGALIAHAHVADSERLPPGQGDFDFRPFFTTLRKIGYDQRISIKCTWRDFASEAAPALAYIKEEWEATA